MVGPCPECGSSNVVEDDLYSQKQWVCEDCGSLVSEGVFTTTLSDEQHSRTVPYYESTETSKKPCPNLIKGLIRVRALCRILRVPGDMESGAVSLFERAYGNPAFLQVRLQKKEVLGGACILLICRQNNRPVTMGTISNLLEVELAFVGVVYQDLIKALNIEPSTATSLINMLESYCYGYKLSPGEVAEVFAETPRRLVERSTALAELAADTWLVTGRQPLPLLMACVYVAWQSLKPMGRMKVSLNKFCVIGGLGKEVCGARKDTAHKRVVELRDVLCKLGKELPWLRGDTVEPGTVAKLVDDILKHRQALHLKAMRHYEEELQLQFGDQLASSDSSAPATSKAGDKSEPDPSPQSELSPSESKLKGRSQNLSTVNTTEVGGEPPAGELHWGKRHLFLPPSVRPDKQRRVDPPVPAVTGDEEISDSEIETYIRSPEEIRKYLTVQQKLKEDGD
uniref:Transcription factor IIIB 50 kDa subunit n=1 Tax=Astyanax mexicanus TaxID=7994 RepID=A0A3B1JAC9_ASTMX